MRLTSQISNILKFYKHFLKFLHHTSTILEPFRTRILTKNGNHQLRHLNLPLFIAFLHTNLTKRTKKCSLFWHLTDLNPNGLINHLCSLNLTLHLVKQHYPKSCSASLAFMKVMFQLPRSKWWYLICESEKNSPQFTMLDTLPLKSFVQQLNFFSKI